MRDICRVSAPIEPKAVLGQRFQRLEDGQDNMACGGVFSCARRSGCWQGLKTPATPTTHETPADGAKLALAQLKNHWLRQIGFKLPMCVRKPRPNPGRSRSKSRSGHPKFNFAGRDKHRQPNWHDPNDTNSATAKSKQLGGTATAKKGKFVADPRGGRAADHTKPAAQTKPCNRTAVGDFLRSLNLAPACDS